MVVKAHAFFATRCTQVQVEQTLDLNGMPHAGVFFKVVAGLGDQNKQTESYHN